jgi:beta-xylosidase
MERCLSVRYLLRWIILGCFVGILGAQSLPRSEAAGLYYKNPILSGDYPDPSVLRMGKNYYMTNTCAMMVPGLLIWHSRDLIHWSPVTYALKQYDGYVAAPCLTHFNGRFYIYYTPGRSTHVIWAKNIRGPWSKPVRLLRDGRPFSAFDPSVIKNRAGQWYLVGAGNFIVRLAANGLSVSGKRRFIYKGWPIPENWIVECGCLEAPKIMRHGRYYYMFSAEGGTSGPPTSHMSIVARARHLTGPWTNSPYNPLVHTYSRHQTWWSTGHGMPVKAPDGDWYLIFHGYRKNYLTLGRPVLMEPIRWTRDGWVKLLRGSRPSAPLPAPGGEVVPGRMHFSDNFNGRQLGFQWRFYYRVPTGRYKLTGHSLILHATGPSMATSSPMVCITGDHAYQISVHVHVRPGANAGLTLYYDAHAFISIGIGGGKIWYGQRAKMADVGRFAGAQAVLKIVNYHNAVECYVGHRAGKLKKILPVLYAGGYTHQTFGNYLSLRPGLYCIGRRSAEFEHFKFTKIHRHSGRYNLRPELRPTPGAIGR